MNKKTKQLEELNRGLAKRLKAATKASENNFHGMMYWKKRATHLESGIKIIDIWIDGIPKLED